MDRVGWTGTFVTATMLAPNYIYTGYSQNVFVISYMKLDRF